MARVLHTFAKAKNMKLTKQRILVATLVITIMAFERVATGQAAPSAAPQQSTQLQTVAEPTAVGSPTNVPRDKLGQSSSSDLSDIPLSPQPLFNFKDSGIKFKLQSLMNILRDSKHESWVLAAYPDPKTSRPLIGAGFGLDVEATEHPQLDPLNPYTFLEPSSAQLWQAAGLDSARLQSILEGFDANLKAWNKKGYRKKMKKHQLPPEITSEQATALLRISAIQATHNARAYCREFDQLTASQQMGLSQLVYQMGINLEEFTQFLGALNDLSYRDSAQSDSHAEAEAAHWKMVQSMLIQSDWARRYSTRAISVIAMFEPDYIENPKGAEREVQATLHPHRHKKSHKKAVSAERETNHTNQTSA
jgi:hypothetical protein